jgi:hypothetical protein
VATFAPTLNPTGVVTVPEVVLPGVDIHAVGHPDEGLESRRGSTRG